MSVSSEPAPLERCAALCRCQCTVCGAVFGRVKQVLRHLAHAHPPVAALAGQVQADGLQVTLSAAHNTPKVHCCALECLPEEYSLHFNQAHRQ